MKYLVMSIYKWDVLHFPEYPGLKLNRPEGGPMGMMFVFDKYEDALSFSEGDASLIHEVTEREQFDA